MQQQWQQAARRRQRMARLAATRAHTSCAQGLRQRGQGPRKGKRIHCGPPATPAGGQRRHIAADVDCQAAAQWHQASGAGLSGLAERFGNGQGRCRQQPEQHRASDARLL